MCQKAQTATLYSRRSYAGRTRDNEWSRRIAYNAPPRHALGDNRGCLCGYEPCCHPWTGLGRVLRAPCGGDSGWQLRRPHSGEMDERGAQEDSCLRFGLRVPRVGGGLCRGLDDPGRTRGYEARLPHGLLPLGIPDRALLLRRLRSSVTSETSVIAKFAEF